MINGLRRHVWLCMQITLLAICLPQAWVAAESQWHPPQVFDLTQIQAYSGPSSLDSAERLAGLLYLMREGIGLGGGLRDSGDAHWAIAKAIGSVVAREDILAALAAERDPLVRDRLTVAAGLAGAETVREDLLRMVGEADNCMMILHTIEALDRFRDASLRPVFTQALSDPCAYLTYGLPRPPPANVRKVFPVRQAAARALARLGITDIEVVTDQPMDDYDSWAAQLASLFETQVPAVCLDAALQLARVGKEAEPYLREFIEQVGDDPALADAIRVAELGLLTERELVATLDDALTRGDKLIYQAAAQVLSARGEGGATAVASAYAEAGPALREALVWVATKLLYAPSATEFLLKLFVEDSDDKLRWQAMTNLADRRLHLQRRLTETEMAACVEALSSQPLERAAQVARFLGSVGGGSETDAIAPLAERLRDEVSRQPVEPDTAPERIMDLSRFVDALAALGRQAPQMLQQHLQDAEGQWALWAAMARGQAGDAAVGEQLKLGLATAQNPYVRYLLVGAVARALGHEAVPVLEQLRADETMVRGSVFFPRTPYRDMPIVQQAAMNELGRLRRMQE